ncbi:hypothetical protein [Liquorilactobacillus vini]|uniref:Uncharacterized protein n=1 Tax=Liquorilactobacillus vini DSM 20605 TaxID=1133569 RepID=A0A0R2CBU8_9LACO|nr:hypothetical protein [Liquorilactobacillus vini]KRM88853.1 hypothetical protein FD21_GL000641 [Liquorilactobacillus vini DSM 20605]
MNNLTVERTEARAEKSAVWRLINQETGNFLDVVFDKGLEKAMKVHRNFSFNRFESEQINELQKLVAKISDNYQLILNQDVIGLDYLPLSADNAVTYLEKE